jgi:hypothetical protein
LDALTHPSLAATPCARFFHACWQDGLHYDVDSRTGVIFNLCDKFLTGTLGIITVGLAPHDIMARMQAVLAFIVARDAELKRLQHPSAGQPSGAVAATSDTLAGGVRPFRELQALVKYMADKSAEVLRFMAGPAGYGGGG